jgi:hypothetical protein
MISSNSSTIASVMTADAAATPNTALTSEALSAEPRWAKSQSGAKCRRWTSSSGAGTSQGARASPGLLISGLGVTVPAAPLVPPIPLHSASSFATTALAFTPRGSSRMRIPVLIRTGLRLSQSVNLPGTLRTRNQNPFSS